MVIDAIYPGRLEVCNLAKNGASLLKLLIILHVCFHCSYNFTENETERVLSKWF